MSRYIITADGEGYMWDGESAVPAGAKLYDMSEEVGLIEINPAIATDPNLVYGDQGSLEYQLATLGGMGYVDGFDKAGFSNPDSVSAFLEKYVPAGTDLSGAIQDAWQQQQNQFGYWSGADDPGQTALKILAQVDDPLAQQAAQQIQYSPEFAQSQYAGTAALQYDPDAGSIYGVPGPIASAALGFAMAPLGAALGGGILGGAGTGALSSAIMGGDPFMGALSGGVAPGLGELGLPSAYIPAASSLINAAINGGDLSSALMGAAGGTLNYMAQDTPTFPQEQADFPIYQPAAQQFPQEQADFPIYQPEPIYTSPPVYTPPDPVYVPPEVFAPVAPEPAPTPDPAPVVAPVMPPAPEPATQGALPQPFDPRGTGYDYETAIAAGMGPDGTGENAGHWGSVAPASGADMEKYGLPDESYVMLKGNTHETFDKGVQGEAERGFKVVQIGDRWYSVPNDWSPSAFTETDAGMAEALANPVLPPELFQPAPEVTQGALPPEPAPQPDVFQETDAGMAEAFANPFLPPEIFQPQTPTQDMTGFQTPDSPVTQAAMGNYTPDPALQFDNPFTLYTDPIGSNMSGFFDDLLGLNMFNDAGNTEDAAMGQAFTDAGGTIPVGGGIDGNVYGLPSWNDAGNTEDAAVGQAFLDNGGVIPQGGGASGNIYASPSQLASLAALARAALGSQSNSAAARTFLQRMGLNPSDIVDPLSSILGGGSLGSNILNQVRNDPISAAVSSAPFLLAMQQAQSQKNDIQPYIDKLNNLQGQFAGNESAYMKSITDPYDMQTARGQGDLTQSLSQRGVLGSSFGNADLANYGFMRDTGRGNLLAQAKTQGIGAQGGLINSALTATNNRNLAGNALIGAGLGAAGKLFQTQEDPFNLKNLLGV
jgi:hypothetical protein